MSRSAPYDNPYASLPTTDAPPAPSSSSSSSTPLTYPPALGSQLQLSGTNTNTNTNTAGASASAGGAAAFAGAGTRPQFYYTSPPSSASATTPGYSGQGHHRPIGSVSSVATLKNETDSPKPWPGTLPHYDKTYDYPYAYDPTAALHRRVDSDATYTPYDPEQAAAASHPLARPHPSRNGYVLDREHDPNRWSYDTVSRPEGVRMFSPAWFKYHWAVQSSRKRLGRLLYIVCGLFLLAVWLTVTMLFGRNLETNEASNSAFYVRNGSGGAPDRIGNLFLVGQLNTFDSGSRNLNLDWTAIQVSQPIDTSDILKTQIDIDRREDTVPLAMFRDVLAVPDLDTNITDYQPYRVQNPHVKPTGFLGLTQFDQINTNIGMGQKSTNFWSQPEFGYPFDVFQGKITWVAADNDTITATGRPGTDVHAISGAVITDSLLNMKVRYTVMPTCLFDDAPGCELIVQFWVTRTGLVKFCVFVVFGINWFVTIALFSLTGESLLLNRHNILESTDIFAVCFSALFALPSVRSLLPGVPGYGCALDLLGILPNMIIITLCTVFFAISRLRLRYRHRAAAKAAAKDQ
ncbi:hypothetical protein FRC14_007165 [Serendipita sp. 396]|nr:hypothetical protein FRC14_007165 [Serendipita sp. 396]KAG8778452.1 hypothetical protein FRC15_010789 [Serendipita sp. 397]KAG8863012.1 hypothetical protein FRC20_010952 [Serendipita sp. 405]